MGDNRGQPAVEPGFCEVEVAIHGGSGEIEKAGSLPAGRAEKVTQFDDPNGALVDRFEFTQSPIERQHLSTGGVDPGQVLMRRNAGRLPAGAFQGVRPAGVILQNQPHHHGRERVEVLPVGRLEPILAVQSQIEFVYEAGCLKGVVAALAVQVSGGNRPQVLVRERGKAGESDAVTFTPPSEEVGDFTRQSGVGGHRGVIHFTT